MEAEKVIEEAPELLTLHCRDFRFIGVMDFWGKAEEAILKGWTVWKEAPPRLAASMGQMPMVTFIKEGDDLFAGKLEALEEQIVALTADNERLSLELQEAQDAQAYRDLQEDANALIKGEDTYIMLATDTSTDTLSGEDTPESSIQPLSATTSEVIPEATPEAKSLERSTEELLEALSAITKVIPLREFSSEASIEIPENIKVATAIKKYLKAKLEEKLT